MSNQYCLLFDLPVKWHSFADWVLAGILLVGGFMNLHDLLVDLSLIVGIFIGCARLYRLLIKKEE